MKTELLSIVFANMAYFAVSSRALLRLSLGVCGVRVLGVIILLLCPRSLASEEPLRLSIERRSQSEAIAQVSFVASRGTLYRLYESSDLAAWHLRQRRIATGVGTCFEIPIAQATSKFFRVESVPVHPLESMVWIEPGEFVMGSPADEEGRFLDKEEPQTRVTLTHGFWISRYEITQAEFEALLRFNPSVFDGDPQRPVENVTWFEAHAYCVALTAQERGTGRLPGDLEYRLPTEAEWEYTARAGTNTRFSYGDDPGYEQLSDHAWYEGNSGLRSHPVGQKLPNRWGLHDMHGNVFEWCADWFARLPGGWVTDPRGSNHGTDRIIRGGYWAGGAAMCRSAVRVHYAPEARRSELGFRIVLAEVRGP